MYFAARCAYGGFPIRLLFLTCDDERSCSLFLKLESMVKLVIVWEIELDRIEWTQYQSIQNRDR